MKVIVSHDVDHLSIWEHKGDLIIPKFVLRSLLELSLGYITFKEIYARFKEFLKNKWNHIEELIEFDSSNNIKSTFFFGVNKGLGLAYSIREAKQYIYMVKKAGFDVGVHGIEYKNFQIMKKEYETFKSISKLESFGIRMHYLRLDNNTLNKLSEIGYLFDSSIKANGYKIPFKVGKMWEFPLHIMDGDIILNGKRWQSYTLNGALDATKRIIEFFYANKIPYLVILFHDRYFSDAFKTWKEWYIKTIEYLKINNFEFIDFKKAIKELEERKTL